MNKKVITILDEIQDRVTFVLSRTVNTAIYAIGGKKGYTKFQDKLRKWKDDLARDRA